MSPLPINGRYALSLSQLPVWSLHDRFHQQILSSDLVIAAETGSGKSTVVPVWAAEHGRVLVVQPRRVACLALAEFVAAETGQLLGEGVGYAVRQEQRFSAQSQILFVTPGIALRWLSEGRLADFRTVMLDEFHERRWDMDLLLALLRQQKQHRLLLTSATMAADRLATWLGGEVLTAPGRNFQVAVRWRAQQSHHMPTSDALAERVSEAVADVLASAGGDILVFLPGRAELQRCRAALAGIAAPVLLLHGGSSVSEQHRLLNRDGERRVILATNVAETSLTLPGITAVIDSGLERRTQQRNGRTVLALVPISEASARQRQGRAGRVADGLCIRLWGEHAPLEQWTPPQLQREALDEAILAAAAAGQSISALSFPEPLPARGLAAALERLCQVAALDKTGQITAHGEQMFSLPLDSFYGHLIGSMPDKGCRLAMIDLCAALSVGLRAGLPADEQGARALKEWLPQACDLALRVQLIRTQTPDFIRLDSGQLAEARTLAIQVRELLGFPRSIDSVPYERERLIQALIRAWPGLAFVRRRKRTDALGNGVMEVQVGRDSLMPDEAMAALVLDDYSLPGRQGTRQTLTLATCMVPTGFTQLVEAGLGELRVEAPCWEEGQLTVGQAWHYAGRVLMSERVEARGAMACRAMAELMVAGQLMPAVAEQLVEDLASWSLYCALGLAEDTGGGSIPTPVDWLASQLETLGLDSIEDLELIDAEDLRFEGVPDWQRKAFDETWPRQIRLSDLTLSVSYQPGPRQVLLEWVEGSRKKDPARWELPGWRGWRIRYRKASRVIDIR